MKTDSPDWPDEGVIMDSSGWRDELGAPDEPDAGTDSGRRGAFYIGCAASMDADTCSRDSDRRTARAVTPWTTATLSRR